MAKQPPIDKISTSRIKNAIAKKEKKEIKIVKLIILGLFLCAFALVFGMIDSLQDCNKIMIFVNPVSLCFYYCSYCAISDIWRTSVYYFFKHFNKYFLTNSSNNINWDLHKK